MNKIICFTNRSLVKGDFLTQIIKIAKAKPDAIVLREKDLPYEEYKDLAEKVLKICREFNVLCIFHKYAEIAVELGADGVHLPLSDLKSLTEKEKSNLKIIGASTHSVSEAVLAEDLGASYITISHIFKTDCKKGLPPKGVSLIKEVKRKVNIPFFALGGINEKNARECFMSGADGVCIMSGFMTCENPQKIIGDINNFNPNIR